MKKTILAAALIVGCIACDPEQNTKEDDPIQDTSPIEVKDPIQVSSPQPTELITKVSLTAEEAAMVQSGNSLTFK